MPDEPTNKNSGFLGPDPSHKDSNPPPSDSVQKLSPEPFTLAPESPSNTANPTGEIPSYTPQSSSSTDSPASSPPPTDLAGATLQNSEASEPSSSSIHDFHPNPSDTSNSWQSPITNRSAQESSSPPTPPTSLYPQHASARPGRPLKKLVITAIVILLLLTATTGALAYKMYYLDALTAPRDLFTNNITDKSGKFTLTATISSKSSDLSTLAALGKATISSSGSYDNRDPKNPKTDFTVSGSLGVSKLAGEVLVADNTLFVKISKIDVLSALGIIPSDSWYKTAVPLTGSKSCDYSVLKNPSSNYLDQLTARNVPIKNASRVGLFENVDGHQTTHYHGELDNAKLAGYISDINKQLSADCQIDLSPADYKDLTVSYDTWSASDFDRFKANLYDSQNKISLDLTLDLSDFNKPVTITAPKDAKDINTLFPAYSLFSSSGPTSVPTF